MELKALEKEFSDSISKIVRAKTKTIERLQAKENRELTRIAERFENAIKRTGEEYNSKQEQIANAFSKQGALAVYKSLKSDYSVLQGKSELTAFSEEEIAKARKVFEVVRDAETPSEKERIGSLVSMLDQNSAKVVEALSNSGAFSERDITSYISLSPSKEVYVLSPTDTTDNKCLSQNLESKLTDIFSHGKIITGSVSTNTAEEFSFDTDIEFPNNFLLYKIKFANSKPQDYGKILDGLKEKISALQPTDFGKMNLTHKVREVSYSIIEFFKDNSLQGDYSRAITEMENKGIETITISRASEMLGFAPRGVKMLIGRGKLKGDNKTGQVSVASVRDYLCQKQHEYRGSAKPSTKGRHFNFSSTDSEAVKEEAFNRVSKFGAYGAELSASQVQEVLGLTSLNAIYNIAELITHRREGRKMYFDAGSLRNYISERTFTGRGWMKKSD